MNPATDVKDQGRSGTCWCFSSMSIIESELLKQGVEHSDLSEMFVVRNIYLEKAKNYILRQGYTRFSEGAFGHDVFPVIVKYGVVPLSVFPNTLSGDTIDHIGFDNKLKNYLDSVLKRTPISLGWEKNYIKMLDEKFGAPPEKFNYEGKEYTPIEFSKQVLKFNPDDYIGLTSFTHHPFYKPFNVEVPDNYSGGLFYNIPIEELIEAAKYAVLNGYTVGWDADVSNNFFSQKKGWAMIPKEKNDLKGEINPDDEEIEYTKDLRQELFEDLTTQDDHLMHIIGLKQTQSGKTFFYVKNSWGPMGPLKGFINVSETYFGINTITLILPLNGLSPEIRAKLKL
ncbi:MAG: aminopeptidase [Ignavibacteriae bacterium]|nr:aminopeptidase [Ignavibacteriota bacterium]